MRTETIWIMAKPGEERFYTLPRPPTKTHLAGLRKKGYQIFTTAMTFPSEFDVDAVELSPVELETKPVTVTINARTFPWLGKKIAYHEVLYLAKMKGQPTVVCSVEVDQPGGKRGFTLLPGTHTDVVDDMIFSVAHTDSA